MLLERKQTQKSTYWMNPAQAKLTMVIEVRATVACGGGQRPVGDDGIS